MPKEEFAKYHLAQLNIGRLRYQRDAPEMKGYCEALGAVGQVAVDWPGFIWMHNDGGIRSALHASCSVPTLLRTYPSGATLKACAASWNAHGMRR